MSKHLHRDLEYLMRDMLAQSSVVEEMIEKAARALRRLKIELAHEVIAQEQFIDTNDVRIEENCLKILALHQPVAIDLRRTATILKINAELERIADQTVNIAERAISLMDHPDFPMPTTLDRMVEIAITMVRKSIDAFVNLDAHLAREICLQDDEVDYLNREVIDQMYQIMTAQPEMIEAAMHFFSAARTIERIADHATNIAEDVIYLVEGEIARHRPEDIARTE